MTRKSIAGCSYFLLLSAVFSVSLASAGEAPQRRDNLKEPILRVARVTKANPNAHPLDQALDLARYGREKIKSTIRDYTCTLVKRERVNGELLGYEYIFAKIRNPETVNGKVTKPFSVYMYFLKPSKFRGREVIYVKGKNDGKLVAHEGGAVGAMLPTVWLDPTSILAMRGQRYPIYDVGLRNLIDKLIEVGERDKAAGRKDCEVTFHEGAEIAGRVCTVMEIKSLKPDPTRKPDYYLARVFIDDELQVPIRYAAYGYPKKEGDKPPVIEEYTYCNLKLNVGLRDKDFDHKNKDYNF
jgi:hypothetical protein